MEKAYSSSKVVGMRHQIRDNDDVVHDRYPVQLGKKKKSFDIFGSVYCREFIQL